MGRSVMSFWFKERRFHPGQPLAIVALRKLVSVMAMVMFSFCGYHTKQAQALCPLYLSHH